MNDEMQLRKRIGQLVREAKKDIQIQVSDYFEEGSSKERTAQIAAEAVTMANYYYNGLKTIKEVHPQGKLSFDSQWEKPVQNGIIIGESVNEARELFNIPGNYLTATDFANRIEAFAQSQNLDYEIMDKKAILEKGMGGVMGVNRGSDEPPKVIVAHYKGNPTSNDLTALIGKGVMYDTGGISLKTNDNMKMSKGDMGGSASAYGTFRGAVLLGLKVNLVLVIPATDNAIGPKAIKPGDVLTMMNGLTVEVTNTDAEGRLVLADAITLAKKLGATRLIDMATLTGAVVASLGTEVTGAFTNNDSFLLQVMNASQRSGELMWHLPLFSHAQDYLKISQVADLDHWPKNKPGAIAAAAFLKEFVGDTPWVHLDIAGTADTDQDYDLGPKGGTGVMVRTLIEYLKEES